LLSKLRRRAKSEHADGDSGFATPVGFGLITGLMPCGPLIAAQVAAAGSGSTTSGGLMMLGFGLGTAPLMLGYGAVASYLGSRFKRYMSVAAAITIIILGIVMMNRGATALGSPVNFDTAKRAVLGSASVQVDESQFEKGADGVIEVPLQIKGYTFTPSTVAIPADTPVRIIVNRLDDNLCSDELWIPSLGLRAPLTANGITKIELPSTKAGTYQITCQMGMLSATLQVGGSNGSRSPLVMVLGLTALAGGVGMGVHHFGLQRRRVRAAAQAAHRKAHSKRPRKQGHVNHSKNHKRKNR
jgi:ABC-type nickel/cobalt efflux system permease component RcnA